MTGARPLVSAVIPTYNSLDLLESAVASVEAQTYREFEIIVVDDGSTDGTPEWAQENARRITCYRQGNQRQAAARNQGARQARGEFLAFLDADDVWLPNKLEIQVEAAQRNPSASFVFSDGYRIVSRAAYGDLLPLLATSPRLASLYVRPPAHLTFNLQFRVNCVATSSVLVGRDLFWRVGAMPNIAQAEDYALCCLLLLQSPAVYVDEPLMAYRVHGQNTSSSVDGGRRAMHRLLMKDRARLFVASLAHALGDCPPVATHYANMSLPFRLLVLLAWRAAYSGSLPKLIADLRRYAGIAGPRGASH